MVMETEKSPKGRPAGVRDPRATVRLRFARPVLNDLRLRCVLRDVDFKIFAQMAMEYCVEDAVFAQMVRRRETEMRRARLARKAVYRHRNLL